MATGAYDANGIWQYGEDDNIALFSDLLKLGTASTSSAFTADRARLSTLEAGSLSGLIPIKPATVTVAGGTAAMSTVGAVSFTNATALSLNNVFSASYRSYRVVVNYVTFSVFGQTLAMRMRTGSTDNSSGIYSYNGVQQNGTGAPAVWQSLNNTQFNLIQVAMEQSLTMDIHNPYASLRTSGQYQGSTWSTNLAYNSVSFVHDLSSPFESFSVYPTSGNMSGIIQVFGYND